MADSTSYRPDATRYETIGTAGSHGLIATALEPVVSKLVRSGRVIDD